VGPGLEIKDFDIYKEAGGFAVPVIMVCEGRAVTDGKLRIEFTKKSDSPCIDAIEVIKTGAAEPKITKVSAPPFKVRSIAPPADSKPKRILFVGNSLTIRWNLPGTVQGLVNSAPGKLRVITEASTQGGANLEWHYKSSGVLKRIKEGHYDYVVLQEYRAPSVEKMAEVVAQYDKAIRESGAKTLIYCTWVGKDQTAKDQEEMTNLQLEVARKLKVTLVPVGSAWQAVRTERPDFNLHNPDKLHPGLDGAYLTACVFYSVLTGRSPEGRPSRSRGTPSRCPAGSSWENACFRRRAARHSNRRRTLLRRLRAGKRS
jgi:hypothetical protein